MEEYRANVPTSRPLHPFRGILVLVGFMLLGMSIGGFLAGLLILAWTAAQGEDAVLNMLEILEKPEQFEGSWYLLMLVQGVSHLFSYLIPGLLFWRLVEHRRWDDFSNRPLSAVQSVGLVVLLTIAFMPFNGLVIEWNQQMDLPDTLAPLEQWMKQKEEDLSRITTFLTTFSSPLQLVIALLVIGVIAAIGEEVIFRGLLQRKLAQWTGNMHTAIWLAAIVFSAIHVQFYGFVPRVLLGALFGYLYVWSRNLWVPILAHFVNNGFTVFMVWLYQRKMVPVDIENTESVPLTLAFFSLLLTSGFLYYFRKTNQFSSPPYD
jgi:uncharacterized protein